MAGFLLQVEESPGLEGLIGGSITFLHSNTGNPGNNLLMQHGFKAEARQLALAAEYLHSVIYGMS